MKSEEKEKDQESRIKIKSQAKGEMNATEQLKKATYERANLPEVVNKIVQLSQNQREDLLQVLLNMNPYSKAREASGKEKKHTKLKKKTTPFYG